LAEDKVMEIKQKVLSVTVTGKIDTLIPDEGDNEDRD
jgi:hypothetical protein